jgi:dipeptide/tripeptide permease
LSRGPERRLTVSPRWLVMDCIGGMLLVVGVLGLTGTVAGVAPALGDPQIGWTLTIVGVGLMAFAAVKLVAELRAHGQPRRSSLTSR